MTTSQQQQQQQQQQPDENQRGGGSAAATPSYDAASSSATLSSTLYSYLPPPGPTMCLASMPLLYRAVTDYRRSEAYWRDLASRTSSAASARDEIRSAASDLARRALKIATYSSLGATSLVLGLVLLPYPSLPAAVADFRRKGQRVYVWLAEDVFGGIGSDSKAAARHELHKDVQATAEMDESQELNYIAQRYFPDVDFSEENESAAVAATDQKNKGPPPSPTPS